MQIKQIGVAGTLESSDVRVMIEPNDAPGISLQLQSPVLAQFGVQIRQVVLSTLQEMGVQQAVVQVNDRGALDCTIRARVQAAILRATDGAASAPWQAEGQR